METGTARAEITRAQPLIPGHSSFDELINLTFAEYESAHGQDGASPVTS